MVMKQLSHDIRELKHLLIEMHFMRHKMKCCVAKQYSEYSCSQLLQPKHCNVIPEEGGTGNVF